MSQQYKLLGLLGVYAPSILAVSTIVILWSRATYLQFYIFGFIANLMLNTVLKLLIKEPRPENDARALEIGIANGRRISFDKYGMPSGHAQIATFITAFVALIVNNTYIIVIYFLLTLMTMCQRYIYNNHTIGQILIGAIVGAGMGVLTYILATNVITGEIAEKKDDDAPL